MPIGKGGSGMGVNIAAVILFLLTAYGAAWVASRYGPFALGQG